jgi:hypothetical protein
MRRITQHTTYIYYLNFVKHPAGKLSLFKLNSVVIPQKNSFPKTGNIPPKAGGTIAINQGVYYAGKS